ncbi:MAG: SLBB domain-containing protein [candidate division Zixibacteria bacterium]|nr:SLBB domain-containing protein [candidate division Zixibacteria bacterium]
MSRRVLIWLLLVIVLVSLNWFRSAKAQTSENLTDDEKRLLLEKYRDRSSGEADAAFYQTPDLYGGVDKDFPDLDSRRSAVLPTDNPNTHRTKSDARSAPVEGLVDFKVLRPFGVDLFDGQQDMAPPIDIASADDYVLGPGDNVLIYLWGRVEKEYNLTLDREGKVFIPRVGEVVGWGLSLEQFSARVKKQLSKAYSEFDLTVSLGKIRSIRVFVTGEVRFPGAYTVSSLTSLFNILHSAGGPNDRGSMRDIRLVRNGEIVATTDLYDFLLKGDNSTDIRLNTGDLVFVPVAGPRVAIRGEINRPAVYELKGGQTASELLALAGNPTPAAHLDRVMLERIAGKQEWEVLDLDLSAHSTGTGHVNLMDGDRLTVYSVFDARTNSAAVFGKVKHPGYYERSDSTCISDLIRQAQLQPYDVYFERANLYRRYHDGRSEVIPIDLSRILAGDQEADLLLMDRDSVHVYSIDEIEWDKYVYIEGEVKRPGAYLLYENMTAQDLVFLAGSYTRGAYKHRAEVARLDSTGEVTLVDLALTDERSLKYLLDEDDHVYVRRLPEWERERSVRIDGEVMYPGRYTLANRDETLYDLLCRAGGFTRNSFPRGLVFKRRTIQDNLSRLNVPDLLDKTQPLVEDTLGNIKREELFAFDLADMNRIIIDVEQILKTEGRQGDIVLEPGDHITVPSIPSGISVMGAVGANGTLKYMEDRSVHDYIKRAGNFTHLADKKNTRLIRADGEVTSRGSTLRKKVELGDLIIVPTKIDKQHNWLGVITTALTATTGALTSIYIVSKL